MSIIMPKKVEVTENGLIFYSNHMPEFGVYCYISEGKTKVDRIRTELFKQPTRGKILIKLIIAVLLFITAFATESLFSSVNIYASTITFLIFAYKDFCALWEDFFHIHISKKNRKRQQFYAAKNMILNSYQKLDGIPNLWEIKTKSKYSYSCDIYTRICATFHGILLSVCFCFYNYTFNIVKILTFYMFTYIICRIFHKLRIFIRLEWLFLENPSNAVLQCSIDGLSEWLELENEIELHTFSY